jgi:hypothetical protein
MVSSRHVLQSEVIPETEWRSVDFSTFECADYALDLVQMCLPVVLFSGRALQWFVARQSLQIIPNTGGARGFTLLEHNRIQRV